jgi:hypothetical protein
LGLFCWVYTMNMTRRQRCLDLRQVVTGWTSANDR